MKRNTHGYTDFHDLTPSVSTDLDKPEVVKESYVVDYTTATRETLTMHEEGGFDYRWVYGLDRLSVKVTSEGTNWWGQNVKQDILKDYAHQDRMGSTTNLTDQFGRVVGRADYNEWGELTYKEELNITSAYRRIYPQASYTGHDWDDVLGMYYAKARFYDPAAKRFVAMDPVKGNVVDPLSLVPYIYCVDNPMKYVDPLGLEPIEDFINLKIQNNKKISSFQYEENGKKTQYYKVNDIFAQLTGTELNPGPHSKNKDTVEFVYTYNGKSLTLSYNMTTVPRKDKWPHSKIDKSQFNATFSGVDYKDEPFTETGPFLRYHKKSAWITADVLFSYFCKVWCEEPKISSKEPNKPIQYNNTQHPTGHPMGVSESLIKLLQSYETGADVYGHLLPQGEPALTRYQGESDTLGLLTIGWGHAMTGSEWYTLRSGQRVDLYSSNTVITREDALDILVDDIKIYENLFNSFLDKYSVEMTQQQYDAFFSLAYQNGIDFLINTSKYSTARYIAYGDLNNAEQIKLLFGDFPNHMQEGTMYRRQVELDIYFNGDYTRKENGLYRYGDIWAKNFTWYPD